MGCSQKRVGGTEPDVSLIWCIAKEFSEIYSVEVIMTHLTCALIAIQQRFSANHPGCYRVSSPIPNSRFPSDSIAAVSPDSSLCSK